MAEGMTEHWYVVKNEPHAKWKQMNSNRKETKHKGTNKGMLSPTNTPPPKKTPEIQIFCKIWNYLEVDIVLHVEKSRQDLTFQSSVWEQTE